MLTRTFKGQTHRVQMMILDKILPPDKTTFAVYILPNHYHPSTAFRVVGTQVYYGENIITAWRTVQQFAGRVRYPHAWKRFLV